MLHVDFETRSRVDLLTDGAYNYASDPSTSVLMMGWAFDDEPVALWVPPDPFPARVLEYLQGAGDIAAFNAQFERLLFEYVLCPDLGISAPRMERYYCVAAEARVNNLPGNLGDCARALGTEMQKRPTGRALIKLFCIPQDDGTWFDRNTHPAEWAEFCAYCIDDVETERDVRAYMRAMTPAERRDYMINERINDVGILIDRDLATAAVQYASVEQADLIAEIKRLTRGEIVKPRGKKILDWVYARLPESMQVHMHKYKDDVRKLTFDAQARTRLLDDGELDADLHDVIEAADFAQASSTGKFKSMVERADPEDDRVRGAYVFCGASGTGRYSARGLQPHNMPRKATENIELVREQMLLGADPETITEYSGDNIMQSLKGMLRYSIMARPGHLLVSGDLSQIEGRVNPWLANSLSGDDKLRIYADDTRDVYLETASEILGERITDKKDPRRQGYGKVPELSLGFGGGPGAFEGMAKNYGVKLPIEEVIRIVQQWRKANPWAQTFWYELWNAALRAAQNPMRIFQAGRVSYMYQPEFMGSTLFCLLPSGRMLSYPMCTALSSVQDSSRWDVLYAKASWRPKATDKDWPKAKLWPGLLCENVTQACAADVLIDVLRRLDTQRAPVIGHTHDEVILEVPERDADYWQAKLGTIMVEAMPWSGGLPLAAETWVGPRYRK